MAARGRPRGFDREQALERVMEVFWAKGYDGAQLTELTAAIGVTPPSFYAAFGSKEAAFKEAVDLYMRTVAAAPMQALQGAPDIEAAIRGLLLGSVAVAVSSRFGGCLLLLGVVHHLTGNETARLLLREKRELTETLIAARLERAVSDGELRPDADIPQLTRFYHGIMQAISFQARDGVPREALQGLIEPAVMALPLAR